MANVLVFDIETIPDTQHGKTLYAIQAEITSETEIAEKMYQKRSEETNGSTFMRHHLHKIIAIAAVLHRDTHAPKIWSLGHESSSEKELIQRFFDGIEKYSPILVSWNGAGFDLPVLHYRALLHSVSAPKYWETGDRENSFRYNNYLNRYHYRHTDLMDVLSCYQLRASASLDDIAVMLGFPGKTGMDGSQVWQAYQHNEIQKIREYCETDVLNTYLIYLRFDLFRGKLNPDSYQYHIDQLKNTLRQSDKRHLQVFLACWEKP